MIYLSRLCCLLCALVINPALASKLKVNGFLSQGLVQNKGSSFVNDNNDISFDLTEIGLNASYQFTSNFRIAGQAVYLNAGNRFDEGARLDYLLADWNFYNDEHSQSHFYIGRIKNYHWLYSSTRDVPMTRPSIILPQSVYFDGTRDMSVGGDGIAFAHKYSSEHIGEIDLTISSAKSSLTTADTKSILTAGAQGKLEHNNDLQVSAYWQPAVLPWRFGAAMTDADFVYEKNIGDFLSDGKLKLRRYYFNAEYFGEKWSISAELLQETMAITGVLFPAFERTTTGQGGFIQTEYKMSPNAQVMFRYERYFANKNDKSGNELAALTLGMTPAYFGFQHDNTIGFSYDFDCQCNISLQLEHHWVKGTARLTPLIIPDPVANPNEHWQLTAVQLTHWF